MGPADALSFLAFCLLLRPAVGAADIRLVDGTTRSEGRVELLVNAEWRTICDETWDLLDAEVACKQLGMGYALVAVIGAGFGQGTVPSLSRRLNCTGSETSLLMCPQSSGATCQHSRDAGVVCSDALLIDGSLRLADGETSPYLYGGRLELYQDGAWGTVCNDVWDRQDAFVACKQMGFVGFKNFNATSFGSGAPSQRILLDNVECFGTEASLTICSHKGIGQHNCEHWQDVGIACSRDGSNRDNIRLVGGRGDFEGRVERRHGGEWQTICGLSWDISDAEVLCWELGFEYAVSSVVGAGFGQGTGSVWEFSVACNGGESSLSNCATSSSLSCSHRNDAGVVCSNSMLRDGSLRLVDGASRPHAGRLEVYYRGLWGTVCDDNWDSMDAAVACRELGYASVGTESTIAIPDGAPSQPIFLDMLGCTGSETRLSNCHHNGFGNEDCDHVEDVKLSCSIQGINYIILGSAVGGSVVLLCCLTLTCGLCVCLCCCCTGRRSKRTRRKKQKQQRAMQGFPNRLSDDGRIQAATVSSTVDTGYPVLQPTHSMSSIAYPPVQSSYSLGTFSTIGEPPAYSGLADLVEVDEDHH